MKPGKWGVGEYPRCKLGGLERASRGGEEQRVGLDRGVVAGKAYGVLEIPAIDEDELELVRWAR